MTESKSGIGLKILVSAVQFCEVAPLFLNPGQRSGVFKFLGVSAVFGKSVILVSSYREVLGINGIETILGNTMI